MAIDPIPTGAAPPLVSQFQCGMCGGFWFMKTTFDRHRAIEIPAFVAAQTVKREAWEAQRRIWRATHPFRPRDQCE